MFRQLKEMFRKEEVPPLTLALGEIPAWITVEHSKVEKIEKDHVDVSRKNIIGNIEKLRELVAFLGSTEHEGVVHPKLEKVVEKSLPLYKKAILSALNRQFPENPDEFYIAATECLKGCLKSSAGPGRYLNGVFPEEMKAIRGAVDQVGREINSMNPVIAETRNKMEALNKIRQLHESYLRTLEEFRRAGDQYPVLTDRSLVLQGEIKVLSEEISQLSRDPRMKQLDEFYAEEKLLNDERERAHGEFVSLGNMIVHVLRRAEKVAQKDHNLTLAKKAHALAELLSKSETPAIPTLCQELDEVLPEIIVMVTHGDISLKNKEEHRYFSNPALLPDKIREIYSRIEGIDNQLNETRRKIEGSSFIQEKESLDRGYHGKTGELAEVEQNLAALDGRLTVLKEEIPSLLQQTEDLISAYSGRKTNIS
jgi:predicted  nucleic acid-binding Zn-ribbon protein